RRSPRSVGYSIDYLRSGSHCTRRPRPAPYRSAEPRRLRTKAGDTGDQERHEPALITNMWIGNQQDRRAPEGLMRREEHQSRASKPTVSAPSSIPREGPAALPRLYDYGTPSCPMARRMHVFEGVAAGNPGNAAVGGPGIGAAVALGGMPIHQEVA